MNSTTDTKLPLKEYVALIVLEEVYKYSRGFKGSRRIKIKQQAKSFESLEKRIREEKDKFFEHVNMNPEYSTVRAIIDKTEKHNNLPSFWNIVNPEG
jgi:hypothetical protein